MNPKIIYTCLAFLGICFWAMTIAVGRSATQAMPPMYVGGFSQLLASVLLLCIYVGMHKKLPHIAKYSAKYLCGCGLFFVSYFICFFLSLYFAENNQQLLVAGLINYLWPVLTTLLSVFVFKKQFTAYIFFGVLLALAGTIVVNLHAKSASIVDVFQSLGANPLAYGLMLAAAFSWAMYSNLSKLLSHKFIDLGAVVCFLFASGIVMLALAFSFEGLPELPSLLVAKEIVALSLIAAFANAFWSLGLRKGHFNVVVSSSYFTPMLSILFICVYLGAPSTLSLWLGCALVVLGAYFSQRTSKKSNSPS